MSEKITVALPYVGARYFLTVPSSVKTTVDFKLWGGGGGAGGRDRALGGNGAGGGYVSGTTTVSVGSEISVYVGQGGSTGTNSTGAGAGTNGKSLTNYGGGVGGNAGWSGWSGGGGGGGGATVLTINDAVESVAGGGGAGGGGGQYSAGYSATGAHPETSSQLNQRTTYAAGGTNGAWSSLLNTYSVWEGNGWYTWSVFFPTTGDYQFNLSIDNYGELQLDEVPIVDAPGYSSVFSNTVTVTGGWHTVKIYAVNTGGPGAIGATITDISNNIIWTTRYPKSIISNGINGENHNGDGGGGGAGGGGYIGGGGGLAPWGDIGAYAGANGLNYLPNQNPYNTGELGNYTVPGGSSDIQYPGNGVGYGGIVNGTSNGGNGYALLTFYTSPSMLIKQDGAYTPVLPFVKIAGSYRPISGWIKINGVWTPISPSSTIDFSTDGTNWG